MRREREGRGERGGGGCYRQFFPLHFFSTDNPNTLTLERSLQAQLWPTAGIEHKKLQQWSGIKLPKASTTGHSATPILVWNLKKLGHLSSFHVFFSRPWIQTGLYISE